MSTPFANTGLAEYVVAVLAERRTTVPMLDMQPFGCVSWQAAGWLPFSYE